MNVTKRSDGNLDVDVTLYELNWFGQALNECCYGFGVKNFEAVFGTDRTVVEKLCDQVVDAYPSTLGKARQNANR